MLNILTEPIIRVDQGGGAAVWVSLPETYSLLMADRVAAFPALRPHQRHAWHAFLCQLGAIALRRAGQSEPPGDAEGWRALLRGLTADWIEDEPWQLAVADITKPALMQPPAGSAVKAAEFKNRVETPDELDMLVTSKNHDLKGAVVSDANADDWLFALVTLQTMEGFSGAGNYGISRMNGGSGNRPAFTLTPSTRVGRHIRRDIAALLEYRPALLDAGYSVVDGGIELLWTLPWDGAASEALNLNKLGPFYIEICRRARLHSTASGLLYAERAASKAARIEAKTSNGITGDPWALIDRRDKKGEKVLTLPAPGFTYRRISSYLDPQKWKTPLLLQLTASDAGQDMQLVARATVRGMGKTEGYYERVIPLRPQAAQAMGGMLGMARGDEASPAEELGRIAKARVDDVARTQRILSHAIQVFAARGDAGKVNAEHRKAARPWLNRLDQIVDAGFFDDLQTEFEAEAAEQDDIRKEWRNDTLVANARKILNEAADSLPCPAIYRYKARVNANGLLEGRLRGKDGFPGLLDYTGGTE